MSTYSRDVRAIRERWGLTQAELGTLLDVHAMTVSKAERGSKELPFRCNAWLRVLAQSEANPGVVRSLLRNSGVLLAWRAILARWTPQQEMSF